MRIERASDTFSEAWDSYLASRPEASLYHRYAWRDFFAGYFGKETEYLVALDSNDAITGVLPLVRLRSLLFGDFFVSLPFVNYGGVVANNTSIAEGLLNEAASLGRERNVSHIEFRHSSQDFDMACRTDKVSMCLDLPDSVESLGASLGSKRRSQIKRPLRENPEVRFGSTELLDKFYAVFSRNMRDLGTPVYDRSMFQYLLDKFPTNTSVVSICIDNTPAAAAFLIFDDRRVEIPWASTVKEFNRISINMLLYWEVLKFAIETGHKVFDFGRSTIESGPYRFKKQWGAEPVPLRWHYWLGDNQAVPHMSPDNAKYRLAIGAWQRLPLTLANLIGPRIVKHLP